MRAHAWQGEQSYVTTFTLIEQRLGYNHLLCGTEVTVAMRNGRLNGMARTTARNWPRRGEANDG